MNKKSIAGSLSRVPSLSFLLFAFPLARSLARSRSSLAGARIRQKSTGAGTLNPARVPPHVREAVSVFDCSPTAPCNAARRFSAPLLRAFSVRLPSRRQNAISNQFKCKLKTTAAYKLFDSPSKNTASKDQTEDKTRGREGGVYGADGRDRTRKGAPEKGISRNGAAPAKFLPALLFLRLRAPPGSARVCIPFSFCYEEAFRPNVCSTLRRNGSRLPMLDCPLNICLSLVPTKVGSP